MFTLNPLPPQIAPSLVAKLVRAEPATIGHFRHWGFMDPGMKAMQQDVRIAGPAVTVYQPGVDGTIIGYALGQLRPGDVLVVDRGGDTRHAGFGGLVAYAAKVAKVAGVIIDGVVTDIGEIRQYGVPVWCRGLSAITTKRIGMARDVLRTDLLRGRGGASGRRDRRRRMRRHRHGSGRRRGGCRPRDRDAGGRSQEPSPAGRRRKTARHFGGDQGPRRGAGQAAHLAAQAKTSERQVAA